MEAQNTFVTNTPTDLVNRDIENPGDTPVAGKQVHVFETNNTVHSQPPAPKKARTRHLV